ncbi:MAG: DJ-1/PfpI family protein [Clostridium sp.]|jgi:protein deglycase
MIYLFLAQGFEEVEAITPLDLLRRAGASIKTVGIGGRQVTGSHGIEVTADLDEKQVDMQNMEMIILPGGVPGINNLEKSPVVQESINYCAQNGKKIAAICAAPSILGRMGVLAGHCAVCYPGYENELKGAEVKTDPVCVSGNIITARGAGVALPFGLKLVEILFGKQKSDEMKEKVQCV